MRRSMLPCLLLFAPIPAGCVHHAHPDHGHAGTPVVIRDGEDRQGKTTLLFGSSPNDVKVSAADTGGRLVVFEFSGKAAGGPPLHVHQGQDEIFWIREGEYLFQVGDQRHRLGPGDTIILPGGLAHTFTQLGDQGRVLYLVTPAGDMEDFFQALSRQPMPPQPEADAALHAAHGMQIVGPPIKPD